MHLKYNSVANYQTGLICYLFEVINWLTPAEIHLSYLKSTAE